MDVKVFIKLAIVLAINVIALIGGFSFNSLVVLCWLKSQHLRMKVFDFTICLLSYVDLLTVATNFPVLITEAIFWIRENESLSKVRFITQYFNCFLLFSLFTLLLVSIKRYLAIFHPIFHRTKVTNAKRTQKEREKIPKS